MQKQISAIISLKDRFSKPLLKMSDNIKSLDQETRSSMNRINRWSNQVEKSIDKALKSTAKWAKRGAILLGGVSFKKGIEGIIGVDDAARKVKSIAGDALQLDYIQDELQNMQYKYGKSVTELGDAWYDAISASVPIDQSLQAVGLAHKMATAGFTDDAQAMKLLATSANAFEIKGIDNMARMADQILLAQNRGVILVGEMAQGFGSINSLSKAIGATFEEQLTALATMTKMGMTAPEAITSYKSILNAFLNETSDTTIGYLESFGLGADFLSAKTFKELGFTGVIKEVMEKTDGDLDKISKIFKNIRGKTGATIFAGAGLEEMDKIYDEIQNRSAGALDTAFETVDGSIGNQMKKLGQKLYTLNTELWYGVDSEAGKKLSNLNTWFDDNKDIVEDAMGKIHTAIAKALDIIKDLFTFVIDNRDIIADVAKVFASFYIVRKVAKWMDKLHKAFRDISIVFEAIKGSKVAISIFEGASLLAVLKPLLLIGFAIKAIITLIKNWDNMKDEYPKLAAFVSWLGTTGMGYLKGFVSLLGDTYRFLKDIVKFVLGLGFDIIFPTIMGWIEDIVGAIRGIFYTISGVLKMILGLLSGNADLMKEGWKDLIKGLGDIWESFVGVVERPISSIVELVLGDAIEKWKKFVNWVKNPIKTRVEAITDRTGGTGMVWGGSSRSSSGGRKRPSYMGINPNIVGKNYKGTSSWRGGYTYLHERGAEIVDLPNGSRVYPHDESLDIARKEGLQLAGLGSSGQYVDLDLGGMHFYGDIKTDKDIDEIGTQIVTRIKKELSNM